MYIYVCVNEYAILIFIIMAPLPKIHLIHASDAPRHLEKINEIFQNLKSEDRIGEFHSLNIVKDLSTLNEKSGDNDLMLILLSNQLEPLRVRIESKFNELQNIKPGIRIAEILVDNLRYDNRFITLPTDLKPIRSREDMDAVWNNIEQKLKKMFPVASPPQNEKRYLKYAFPALAFVLLVVLVILILPRNGSNGRQEQQEEEWAREHREDREHRERDLIERERELMEQERARQQQERREQELQERRERDLIEREQERRERIREAEAEEQARQQEQQETLDEERETAVEAAPTPALDDDLKFPEFPWPPPEASASVEITELVKESRGKITKLGDVDNKLRRAFEASGYVEKSYFAVPDGFALVTRLEQINPDGTPKDPGRWSLEREPLRNFSLREYLRALFFADPGLFRVVVFIVTPHPFSQSDKVIERDEAIDWLRVGLNRLPSSVASQEYTDEFRATALIYQFENPETREPRLSPSHLTGRDHLVGSGFLLMLENM